MNLEEPPFETNRLILRIHQWSDAADIFGYAQNPEVDGKSHWKL